MASFSHSHHHCKLAKLLTIYFRSCGLATKAFDTLHALGVTMSQKWAYCAIKHLSEQIHITLLEDIERYPWFGCHDNINLPFKVYEQRLTNQSHFDSGTAATILVIKDPSAVWPDNQAFQQQRVLGAANLIAFKDIIKLKHNTSPRLKARAVHQVLMYLTTAPDFSFETYAGNMHLLFNTLPTEVLPIGPEHTACQYMLNMAHIEEASYEGNDRVLREWWHQLKLNTMDKQKQTGEEKVIVWVGDQLTVSRLQGLQKFRCNDLNSFECLVFLKEVFRWFHLQIAFEHSLHSQYYGTQLGFGLVHVFDLLKHKGLHSPTVEGTFHHHLKEGLLHISEARFRDLWSIIGKVNKLADLRSHTLEQLHALAIEIVNDHASTAALQRMAANKSRKDELLYQSMQMARDLLDYVNFDMAIKIGDVGYLQDLLPCLLFRFISGKNKNYAIEILELLQGLHREWPSNLR